MINGKLKIVVGEEYKAKLEKLEEFENSIFKDQYSKAFNSIRNMLSKPSEGSYEEYNNIISFIGERGSGKTSAMISLSNALKEEYKSKYNNKAYKELQTSEADKYKFMSIDVIDPSHFNEKINLLEIIIAKLFKKFKGELKGKGNSQKELQRKVVEKFEEVYENLKVIEGTSKLYEYEKINALLKLSASTDLKGNIKELLENYMEFMNGEGNNVLLIEIDDIDLNIEYAYEMIEQIRKYLQTPNVVILMALKIDQINNIVEKRMREKFEVMLDGSHMDKDEPKNMATKYLEKLIPLERRLFLPTLEGINLNMELEVQKIINKNEYTYKISDNKRIENLVRVLIFKRTGNMFFNTKTHISFIIPRTLRELVNLVSKLILMGNSDKLNEEGKKIEIKIEEKEQKDKNNKEFREYFINHWIGNNLNTEHKNIVHELMNIDIKERNKYITRKLALKYKESLLEINELNGRRKEYDLEDVFKEVTDFANKPNNISFGDVLLVLELINRLSISVEDKKFLFAIKTLYSLMLYGLIREIKALKKLESLKGDDNKIEDLLKYRKIYFEDVDIKELISIGNLEKVIERIVRSLEDKISEYRSLLGKELFNQVQYNNLKDLEWSYNKRDVESMEWNNTYESISDSNSSEDFLRFIQIMTTTTGSNQNQRRSYEIEYLSENPKTNNIIFKLYPLGFFYNFLERKDLKCYLGNIELLERLFTIRLRSNLNAKERLFEFLEKFMEMYNKIIKKDFEGTDYGIEKDSIVKEVKDFIIKYKSKESGFEEYFLKVINLTVLIEGIEGIGGQRGRVDTILKRFKNVFDENKYKDENKFMIDLEILGKTLKKDDMLGKEEIEKMKERAIGLIKKG